MHSGKFSRFCVGSLCPHFPPFLNPLLSLALKFFYIIIMPPAVLSLCLRPRLCCGLSKQHSGPSVPLCAAASVWQQNIARLGGDSFGLDQDHFQRNCWCWTLGVRALLSTSISATNLYMVFGKSLTFSVPQLQKYLGAQCHIPFGFGVLLGLVLGFFWGGIT